MSDNENTKETTPESTESKGSPLKLILLVVIVLVLGAGGFLGWQWFMKSKINDDGDTTDDPKSAAKKNVQEPGIIYPLESFIVNLMDRAGSGKRYLKITIELEVESEEDNNRIQERETQLKDTIILLLSGQTFKDINSMEGKLYLKQSLLSRINQVMGEGLVRRLYFTEFVVQ